MKSIISVETAKNGKKTITLEDGEQFVFFKSDLYGCGFAEGDAADVDGLRGLEEKNHRAAAMRTALSMLSRKSCTESEMRRALLRKGYKQSAVDEALEKNLGYGYIDDEKYAARLVEQKAGEGRRQIEARLRQRGIDRETADQALSGYTQGRELSGALEAAKKMQKRYAGQHPREASARIFQGLLRRGYDYQIARRALDQLGCETPDE